LFFGHKNKSQIELKVDLGDLQNEKENLASFLQLHLKVSVSQVENKLTVDSEKVSLKDLEHVVNKFVYHRDLNNTHWVSVEGASTVKINRFKVIEKKEKHEPEPPHQTAMQSWGL
jgi:aspartate carbamoyltransferase regulatory subunit